MSWILNSSAAPAGPFPAPLRAIIGRAAHRDARAEITSWPGYEPTPLRNQWRLAEELRVGSVWVKDESGRFGLGSFKALGGAYGVREVMRERSGEAGRPTVACASDGNHGRAVAWGAMRFGCGAVIYLPAHVTEARASAIRSFGARVVRVDGEYDDAVARADRDARENGWTVISDTSYPGYMDIPRVVMVGYTVMVSEVLGDVSPSLPTHTHPSVMTLHPTGKATASAIPPSTSEASSRVTPPTHVFIQGGVGGLAAAVIGHFWKRLGARRPVVVIVEPEEADGLLCSARAGRPVASGGNLDTVMAGLLGLIEVARDEERRREIGLDERSRVLVFNTEGATDPELYGRIVGGGDSFRGDSRHR